MIPRYPVFRMTVAETCLIQLILLLTYVACRCLALEYTCYPNGTVIMDNPDPSVYVSVQAEDDDEKCGTEWMSITGNNSQLKVTGCDLDVYITVSFSDRLTTFDDNITAGSDVATVQLFCAEIAETGIVLHFTLGVSPILDTTSVSPVTITIPIQSALRSGSHNGPAQTGASVGDLLYWTLDVPSTKLLVIIQNGPNSCTTDNTILEEEYTMVPLSCTVYAGTSTAATPSKLIIINGCTTESDLVEHFSPANSYTVASVRRYYSRLWAFRFQSSPYILIHCQLTFCTAESDACAFNCTSAVKKRNADVRTDGVEFGSSSSVLEVRLPATNRANGVIKIDPTSVWIISIVSVVVYVLLR